MAVDNPHQKLDEPPALNEHGPFIDAHLETVAWHGHMVRVPPLPAQSHSRAPRAR
jgi:hypothetical protein